LLFKQGCKINGGCAAVTLLHPSETDILDENEYSVCGYDIIEVVIAIRAAEIIVVSKTDF